MRVCFRFEALRIGNQVARRDSHICRVWSPHLPDGLCVLISCVLGGVLLLTRSCVDEW